MPQKSIRQALNEALRQEMFGPISLSPLAGRGPG